jgi:carboxylesterase
VGGSKILQVIPGAEEFYFNGGKTGCLLVHGFTGSPAEMRLLGQYLRASGYTVLGVRLEGHGTSPEDMLKTDESHWYRSAEEGLLRLQRECEKVFVIGLSMGGVLSLDLASNYKVAGVVALSAPIFINNNKLTFLPVYRLFRTYESQSRKPLPVDAIYSISYDRTPLKCVTSLLNLIKTVKLRLAQVTAPALIVQSRVEHTVKPESADYIYKHLVNAKDKKLIWLDNSGHIVTLDNERDTVFASIGDFMRANS